MNKSFFFLLAVILTYSCSTSEKNAITFDTSVQEYESTYDGCNPNEERCASLQFNYIEITSTEHKDKINAYIVNHLLNNYTVDTLPETFDELSNLFFADYEQNLKDFPDSPISWEITEDVKIYNQFENYICLKFDNYQYLGGAHGLNYTRYITFDLSSGEIMTFEDFFNDRGKEGIGKLMENRFRNFMGIPEDEAINEESDLIEDHITPNDNFVFSNDSVIFYFNPYEISTSSYGTKEFGFAKSEVAEFMLN